MNNDARDQIHYYWDQGLDRYQYFDSHSIEWLRNTANQLALVNSLGATISVALAAGMQSAIFLLPGVAFFSGATFTLLAAFFAHRGNEKYAHQMKDRLKTLSEKNRSASPDTLAYAKEELRLDATRGDADHKLARNCALASFASIGVGALFMLPILLCGMK